jgi:intein-encoded DNA endonuclease-like protein
MNANLSEKVNKISEDYMKDFLKKFYESRAKVIASSEFAKFRYSVNATKKKLLKNL